jgi:hypothetical protein
MSFFFMSVDFIADSLTIIASFEQSAKAGAPNATTASAHAAPSRIDRIFGLQFYD